MPDYENQLEQMIETVDGFFAGEKIENLARMEFLRYRDESLAAIPEMDPQILADYPYYAAIGFLGKLHFFEGTALTAFNTDPTDASLTALRKSGDVQMGTGAVEIWKGLHAKHPEAALAVIALCSLSAKNAKVKHALKPFLQLRKK